MSWELISCCIEWLQKSYNLYFTVINEDRFSEYKKHGCMNANQTLLRRMLYKLYHHNSDHLCFSMAMCYVLENELTARPAEELM